MRGIIIAVFASLLVAIAACSKSSTSKYKSVSAKSTEMSSAVHPTMYYVPRISFYASSTNTSYNTYADAQANASTVDICFVYDSVVNLCFFVSPDSLASVHMPALTGATHSNINVTASISQTDFNNIKNDSLLQTLSPTTTAVTVDTVHRVYSFKNAAGKAGVMYGNVTAIEPGSYSGNFLVKVQP